MISLALVLYRKRALASFACYLAGARPTSQFIFIATVTASVRSVLIEKSQPDLALHLRNQDDTAERDG